MRQERCKAQKEETEFKKKKKNQQTCETAQDSLRNIIKG